MKTLRCAVYTRKSTEDGLEQDFNSLHAQREACEAYIKSQASEGWQCLPDAYDDGGFSGGNMNRPGLKALLSDINAGKVDIVVVYKVDRLTRSLLDFSRIIEKLDGKGVSFVSVTQSFNTTSSMGRLTLNVLLSFAQFEREVTAERIRDKIAASKKKGIWMGGPVPLGYDLKDRQLFINEEEAKTIRWIFETYLKVKNVRELKLAADRLGLRSKRYTQGNGKTVGGNAFLRGQLYCLLKNPLYAGKIKHKDMIHEGLHKAIIDKDTWVKVQALLAGNGGARQISVNTPSRGWLARLLVDSTGEPMVASQATKAGRRYRYYVSASLMARKPDNSKGWRLPARQIEQIVMTGIKNLLEDPVRVLTVLRITQITAEVINKATAATAQFTRDISYGDLTDLTSTLRPVMTAVRVSLYEVAIDLNVRELGKALGISLDEKTRNSEHENTAQGATLNDFKATKTYTITIPVQLKRRGVEMRIILPGQRDDNKSRDVNLINLVTKAHDWFEQLKAGTSITDIAKAENIHLADASRFLPLAFLAPDIVSDILEGTQPVDLTAEKLKRLHPLPYDWQEQRQALGYETV